MLRFGRSYITPRDYFTIYITIDQDNFETDFYVISDDVTRFPVILGNNLLEQAELTINQDEVQIVKSKPDRNSPIAAINIIDEIELNIGENVCKEEKQEIQALIEDYKPNKIKDVDVETVITLKNDKPVSYLPRRLSPSEKEVVNNQIQEWIKGKIIEPCTSEYASPVVVIWKKDGSPRICIDYRRLNKKISKDRYPLSLIEDLLDRLSEMSFFDYRLEERI